MLKYLQIFVVLYFHSILIEASISNLSVKKVDRRLIQRKRQDTLEMCRMFTEDEEKSDNANQYKRHNNLLRISKHKPKRIKREVTDNSKINPTLNNDDEIRVEKIVDKMYDDMNEKGERVTYRRNKLSTPVTTSKKPRRRYNFAPSQLLGPLPEDKKRPSYQDTDDSDSIARFKYGIVPYYIDSKTYDSDLADIIIKAFDYFEKATCIRLQRLRERPTDKQSLQSVTWLYITNPSGIRQCVHSNERMESDGVQMIVFGYDCMSLGDIVHELMHVLGFSHEHTRFDRDGHITIVWDNIKPGYKKYFELSKGKYESIIESLPYDYGSVLHYPPRAFSRNGQFTIITKPGVQIGQREGLSETDIEKVSLVYSKECIKRNKDYLLKTCPSVVKNVEKKTKVSKEEIDEYFRHRLWPYGIVNFKLKDKMEFSAEERENIRAVISHIEKETCIKFRDITDDFEPKDSQEGEDANTNKSPEPDKNNEDQTPEPDNNDGNHTPEPDTNDESRSPEPDIINENKTSEPDNNNESTTPSMPDSLETKPASAENEISNIVVLPHTNGTKRYRRNAERSIRRHAKNILILKRSTQPGCVCPSPGRPDNNQEIKINSDCFNSVNDLLHVFVHVLGLDHQHSMHDRDQYLHIVWDKLSPDMTAEMKNVLPPAASVGFQYDYQSVMHFPWLQIKNGVTNIMYPIWNDGWAMGHWQGLSSTDVQKLNLLYFDQCTSRSKQTQE